MAKKPGSWKALNKITKTVSVASCKKSVIASFCATLYIGALIPGAYFGVQFLQNILSYNGIKTNGKLPDINEGDYFQVDFTNTPLRDNFKGQKTFEEYNVPANPTTGVVERINVRATSLRLEYAYNYIFNQAPKTYISRNFLYKNIYKDPNKIAIFKIYTDAYAQHELSLKDVQRNNLNLVNNILYLKIKYNGEIQKNLIIMPTIFIGTEGFLSNFIQFKMFESMKKDEDKPIVWTNQKNILGKQANGLVVKGETNGLKLDDEVYDQYQKYFNNLYLENKGDNKEFVGDYNPYSNFVISSVSEQDRLNPSLPLSTIDDYEYLFDMNAIINDSNHHFKTTNLTASKSSSSALGKDIKINTKYVPQLFVFLKNVLATTKNPNLVLPKDIVPDDWKPLYDLLTPKTLDINKPEEFYFMFLPEGETIQNILENNINSQIRELLNGEIQFVDLVDKMKTDILTNPVDPKYQWLFKWNILPFQTYANSETSDYLNVKKRTIQEAKDLEINLPFISSSEFITIDHPQLHHILNLKGTVSSPGMLDFSNLAQRNYLFSNYWNTTGVYGLASNQNNVIKIDPRLVSDTRQLQSLILKGFTDNTWKFVEDINNYTAGVYNVLNGYTKVQYESSLSNDYNIEYNVLSQYHIKNDFNAWTTDLVSGDSAKYYQNTALDLILKLKNPSGVEKQFQQILFRFNLHYVV
ncbi:hypothetical protein P344_01995 [Spiroplasma mirum ATCC 29335]|uniref:Uncharacterized protein n=1 Tax=Spiroplasma mirum ATCC 29335 TaxID=838561 RepID=W0GKK2_9MOLU|nr:MULTISPECIES: hypothetical protein [Spiroplasma]AHF60785.1 hypothetical protein SMM_0334 [Spiroplasma mirum ATCC 29335]AHI57747.1 hypothetical protein P344_01995 [Spiroplasma mirum ATCC 29335]AKM52899.1 hypothetical protein SATRI_v1c03780 [Spiroplasma atrichopogonis]